MKSLEEFRRLEKSAASGSVSSMNELAELYVWGCAWCEKRLDLAFYWYDRAIAAGCKSAYARKTSALLLTEQLSGQSPDPVLIDNAIQTLVEGANNLSISSATRLGELYSHIDDYYDLLRSGRGIIVDGHKWYMVETDYTKAFYYYNKALENFHTRGLDKSRYINFGDQDINPHVAAFGLAWLYWHGYGVEKDDIRALMYALKAFKWCEPWEDIHELLREIFDAGVGGKMSFALASACARHDVYPINDFVRAIESMGVMI